MVPSIIRHWVILVCLWLVSCSSPGLGKRHVGAHLNLASNVPGELLEASKVGHLSNRGQQLHSLYQSKLQKESQKIIFACTKGEVCGGLGDRLKGFVSVYILAVLLNAEFAIAWNVPFPLGDFYNSTAAVASETNLLSCRNHTNWSWLNHHADVEKLKFLRSFDFGREYMSSDCVTVHLNGAVWNHFILNDHLSTVAASYYLPSFSKREVFQLVVDMFFGEPMPVVLASVQQIRTLMQGRFHIGVQMRFGGLWGDPQRYEGSSVETIVACFARKTLAMCLHFNSRPECSVFITSDNNQGTALLKDNLEAHGVHVVSSMEESVHLDERTSDSTMQDQVKTFADWETLRSMDRLVCSRSGFGETASWAGNVPAAILKSNNCCFSDEGIEVPEGADTHSPEDLLIC